MEIDKIYRIQINDGLYIEITFDGERVLLVPDGGNIDNVEDVVTISNTKSKAYIKVAGIPKCVINIQNGIININDAIIPTAAIRNNSELDRAQEPKDIKKFGRNFATFLETDDKTEIQPMTDLHTHFMEVLSGEEFLGIVLEHIDYIGIDYEGNLCSTYPRKESNPRDLDNTGISRWYSKEEILNNYELYNFIVKQLSLPVDKQVEFGEINKILNRRTALLDLIGYLTNQDLIDGIQIPERQLENAIRKIISDTKSEIYFDMLIASLNTLKNQGVGYVEFSYSTHTTIQKMHKRLEGVNIKGIDFNFLLSENRNAPGSSFREYPINPKTGEPKRNKNSVECNLRNMIKKGLVKGFDLMGLENPITANDYIGDSLEYSSLYDKLEPVLKVLNSFNDDSLVCRLHSGEIEYETDAFDTKSNPEKTLEILDRIVENNKLQVPPPTIRIGHGLHIKKNKNYLDLLKKYKVIVEINASSNFTLSNIKDMKDIPYRWYYENGIPMVLGTDGGGFYLTTPTDEAKIAELFGGKDILSNVEDTEYSEMIRRGH